MNTIVNVIPNENWQLAIKFGNGEYRLLNLSIPREEFGWAMLAYPQHMKRYRFNGENIDWEFGGSLKASYLYDKSEPVSGSELERHSIRICYKNQAPTTEDKNHHVYGVYLYPFTEKLFAIGESIGGGHADRGGSRSFSLGELLDWQDWKRHFELSGCSWAIEIIEKNEELEYLIGMLVREACKRNGT